PLPCTSFLTRLSPVRGGTGLYHTRRTAVLGNLVRGCIPGGSDRTLHVGAAPCMLPGGGGGHARGNQDQRGGEQDRGFQSRTSGSGRGACDETYVPTANDASSSRCSAARR